MPNQFTVDLNFILVFIRNRIRKLRIIQPFLVFLSVTREYGIGESREQGQKVDIPKHEYSKYPGA